MKLTSPAFADKLPVPVQYTCKGENISPPFEFLEVPKDAKSLVLLVADIDSSNNWIHWLVYNIPATVTHFDEGKTPDDAVNGICNDGTQGYKGPCPKYFKGVHHFSFKLFALDKMLEVPLTADFKVIQQEMQDHILDTSEFVGVAEGEQISETVK
jgi:Raf kinase inhibitor-like YbhB/YbcL family protein